LGSSLYLALHTNNPGPNSAQSEVQYTGYARQALARGSFSLASSTNGNVLTFNNDTTFPAPTQSSTVTQFACYWSLNTALTGGSMLYYGPLNATIPIGNGIAPTITAASSITEF
jgi:hypothetical protein